MKKILLPFAALVALAAVALAQARTEDPVPLATLSLSLPDPFVIRVDAKHTVPALAGTAIAPQSAGKVQDLVLRFAVNRADVLSLRPPAFGVEIDNVALLTMSADRPVWIEAKARPAFLGRVNTTVEGGGTLADLAADPGNTGFPALFDLENYSFQSILQEGGTP